MRKKSTALFVENNSRDKRSGAKIWSIRI